MDTTAGRSSPAAGERFEALDSWRGICALAVVLFHLNAATHFHTWLNNGYIAVDFFFVLSGFVIASAYQERVERTADFGRFVVRRLGRLYPLHVAVLGVYLLLEFQRAHQHPGVGFTGERTLPAFFVDLALAQGFNGYDLTWNMPAWSISVELWTNVGFAALALWAGRRLPWVSGLVVLALGAVFAWKGTRFGAISEAETQILKDSLQCVMEFFLGVLALNLFRWAQRQGWRPWGALEWLALPAAAATFAFAPWMAGFSSAAVFTTVVLLFAFEAGPVSRALKHRFPLMLGTTSYSIYLTHSLYTLGAFHLVGFIGRSLKTEWLIYDEGRDLLVLGGPWAMDLVALACLAVTVLSSIATYRWIEDPARRMVNRWSNRIGASSPAQAERVAG